MARLWCGLQGRTWEGPNPLESKEGGCVCPMCIGRPREGQGHWNSAWGSVPGTLCLKEAVTNIPPTPAPHSFPSRLGSPRESELCGLIAQGLVLRREQEKVKCESEDLDMETHCVPLV